MELEGKLLEVDDIGTGIEGKETKVSNVSGRSELNYHHWCFELEEKCKRAEERCSELEREIERKTSEFELLEGENAILILDKLAIEDELRVLEKEKNELQNRITNIENRDMAAEMVVGTENSTDSIEKEDKVFELMVENKTLNVELQFWEAKCKILELRVAELEKSLYSKDGECALTGIMKAGLGSSGGGREIGEVDELQNGIGGVATPGEGTYIDGAKRNGLSSIETGYGSRARKQLFFEEGTPNRKMAPLTPASARPSPVCPINISDSDEEVRITEPPLLRRQARKKANGLTDSVGVPSVNVEEIHSRNNSTWSPDQIDKDDVLHYHRKASSVLNAKRRKAPKVVTSDHESDTDDNLPIGRLKRVHSCESSVPSLLKSNSMTAAISENKNKRRRLVPLRKQYQHAFSKKGSYGNLQDIESDTETQQDESDTDDESLDDVIITDTSSEGDNASEGKDIPTNDKALAEESDDASDSSNMYYADIISRIGRRKDHLIKWEFEGDMLAAFGKDPELCMKAVCALYRMQTPEERLDRSTMCFNQRGFSQIDALRGSILGEFLTDGDPLGDIKKSVKELQEYEPKGVEICRKLATRYSKQLFRIYQNKEDPLWPAAGPN